MIEPDVMLRIGPSRLQALTHPPLVTMITDMKNLHLAAIAVVVSALWLPGCACHCPGGSDSPAAPPQPGAKAAGAPEVSARTGSDPRIVGAQLRLRDGSPVLIFDEAPDQVLDAGKDRLDDTLKTMVSGRGITVLMLSVEPQVPREVVTSITAFLEREGVAVQL
jgi:hypothetical protein